MSTVLTALQCREDFPVLKQTVRDKPLAYLDSAATTQKPRQVIAAIREYYEKHNANIHRGVYALSQQATEMYENVRLAVQQAIKAEKSTEIVFVKGTTEAVNLVAAGFEHFLKAGDEILISQMEHHANIVPWQIVAQKTGALIKVIPITEIGEIDLVQYAALLSEKTKMIAITHVSNVLGTINPIKKMVALAKAKNIPVFVDGAQALPHCRVDVQDLDCDFYAFSSHKMYGPTGIGVLYGKEAWLEKLPPYQTGGDMIRQVSFEKTTFNALPYKFEAGTPNIAGVIGMGAALEYLQALDPTVLQQHEKKLMDLTLSGLKEVKNVRLIGTAPDKVGVISFVINDIHAHDIGTILDTEGVAVRVGHHCAMPLMDWYQVPATVRLSLGVYTTHADITQFLAALQKVKSFFG